MPSNYCGKVPHCKNSWWCAADYRPSDNVHCFDPTTNYDRIISKTPEELASYLARLESSQRPVYARKEAAEWLDWLQEEAT